VNLSVAHRRGNRPLAGNGHVNVAQLIGCLLVAGDVALRMSRTLGSRDPAWLQVPGRQAASARAGSERRVGAISPVRRPVGQSQPDPS